MLGVAPGVDDETLRRAYRSRLREAHPDTGGSAAEFVKVQRAWERVSTPSARAEYDRGHGFGANFAPDAPTWRPPRPASDTRPRARSYGQAGGYRRDRYLTLLREWMGRGTEITNPYDPALVRAAPTEIRRLLAEALVEESTARIIADLGMGYTVWHDVQIDPGDPTSKLDHVVLGPSGLYAVLSEDPGGPVQLRRGEIVADGLERAPVASVVARARVLGRRARVRFSGALVVVPDEDVSTAIEELGKVKGLPVAVVALSALSTVLRRGITGARDIGGNELFDVRTRAQQVFRFV